MKTLAAILFALGLTSASACEFDPGDKPNQLVMSELFSQAFSVAFFNVASDDAHHTFAVLISQDAVHVSVLTRDSCLVAEGTVSQRQWALAKRVAFPKQPKVLQGPGEGS